MSKNKKKNKNKPWDQAGGIPGIGATFGTGPDRSPQSLLSSAGGSLVSNDGVLRSLSPDSVETAGIAISESASKHPGSSDDLATMSEQQLFDEAHTSTESVASATSDNLTKESKVASDPSTETCATNCPPVSKSELIEALRDVRRTKVELAKRLEATDLVRVEHERAKKETLQKLEELSRREESLTLREKDVSERDSGLESRRLSLLRLEAEADQGFPDRLRGARVALEAELQRRQAEIESLKSLVQHERDALDKERATLARDRIDIERAKREVALKIEHQKDLEQLAEEMATSRVKDHIEQLELKIKREEEAQKRLRSQIQDRQSRITELETLLGRSGGASLIDVTIERDRLRNENERLQIELLNRPGQATIELYKKAEERAEALEIENQRLGGTLSQLRSQLDRLRIPVNEMDTQRIALQSLELRNAALKDANDQLQIEVEGRLNQASGRNPYPELERMDSPDSEYQNPPGRFHEPASLKQVVDDVRNRMAANESLFYDDRTIRCFLAGLAMSRLHLLQGISGTGKTSLPRAFATALGGHADIVAVQAGWRDRQDLLGYYNAFDKKYHESSFVKALYGAQCPTWANRIFIVVLDEMNLSYIEQFGADLLSELESPKKPNLPQLGLMDSRPPKRPARLLDDGTSIAVPPNVWFVGTANHDETTKDFADKTYDRAHTMELPRHPTNFKPIAASMPPPTSCESIHALFDSACRSHAKEGGDANSFVTALEPVLKGKFNIGWGNRLERQIGRFAPVVLSAGGKLGEAIDHVVSTKLLRKLRNRHDVRVKDLQELRTLLQTQWKDRKLDSAPTQCEELLSALIRTRSFEEGEAAS